VDEALAMRTIARLRYVTAAALLALGVGGTHAALAASAPRVASGTAVDSAVAEASGRFAIPPNWIRAVMQVESGSDPHALSPKGAIGLMQIMPATWAALRQRYHLGSDPFDTHDNILAGTALLRELYDRFGAGGFLAAYNAGPSRYLAFLTQGLPLKVETQLYLAKLARLLPDTEIGRAISAPSAPQDWHSAPLFAANRPASDGPVWAAARPDKPSAAVPAAAISNNPPGATPSRLAPNAAGLFAALTAAVTP
jgi:hypothetical protein